MRTRMHSLIAGALLALLSMVGGSRASAQELIIIPIIPKPQAESLFSESFDKLIDDVRIIEDRVKRQLIGLQLLVEQDVRCEDIDAAAARIRVDLSKAGKRVYASPIASFGMRRDTVLTIAAYRVILERIREGAESKYCFKI